MPQPYRPFSCTTDIQPLHAVAQACYAKRMPVHKLVDLSGYSKSSIEDWMNARRDKKVPTFPVVVDLLNATGHSLTLVRVEGVIIEGTRWNYLKTSVSDPILRTLFTEALARKLGPVELGRRIEGWTTQSWYMWMRNRRPIPYRAVEALAKLLSYKLVVKE